MNINKEQIDDLNIVVSVQVGNDDYGVKVGEVLRDYRRKANMPGFRTGKVPEGLIRKMYGKAVLIDEINKLVSESLQNYIKEQDLKLLGDPMPKVNGDDLDWEIGNDFTFDFEMGLSPDINVNLSKEDQITKYQIVVEQDIVNSNIENYSRRFGQFVEVDAVVDFKEKLTGDIVQLGDDGQPLQDGLSAEDSSLVLLTVSDEERKKQFANTRTGVEIVFNLSETFPNEWEIASILKKKDKAEVGDIRNSLFRYTVKSIQKFVNAEVNQELFDKVFGEGKVTDFEEFENQIRKSVELAYGERCMAKFSDDAHDYFLEKINPALPEEFLRKWLKASNKEMSEEAFEKEFPVFMGTMKWELIVNAIIKEHGLKVEEQEIINFAKAMTRRQLSSYGASNISDEDLTGYAMNYLKDEKNVRDMASQVLQNKVAFVIHETVDVVMQEISFDDFNQMMYEKEEAGERGEAGEVDEMVEAEEVAEIEKSAQIVENAEIEETEVEKDNVE